MFNKAAFICVILAGITASGAGQAQQYFCTVSPDGTYNWIPPEFLIEYSGGAATVSHGWIDAPSVRQVPVRGNDNRRRLSYTLADAGATTGQRATMRVSLTHTVNAGSLRVVFDPIEYSNRFTGSGSCVVVP